MQWTAYDPARWDHHFHAGVQEIAYRTLPESVSGGLVLIKDPLRVRASRFLRWLFS